MGPKADYSHSTSMKSILATLLARRRVLAEHCGSSKTTSQFYGAPKAPRLPTYLADTDVLGLAGLAGIFHRLHGLFDWTASGSECQREHPGPPVSVSTHTSLSTRCTTQASGVVPKRLMEASIASAAYSFDPA